MLFMYCQLEHRVSIKVTFKLYNFCAVYTSLKSKIMVTHNQNNN